MSRPVSIPPSELTIRFSRSSGPGGQNVNKRDTKAEVVFDVRASSALSPVQKARALDRLDHRLDASGRLHVTASAARTQKANRDAAVARLEALLIDAVKPPPAARKRTRPSKASTDRRIAEKRARAGVKRQRRRPSEDD